MSVDKPTFAPITGGSPDKTAASSAQKELEPKRGWNFFPAGSDLTKLFPIIRDFSYWEEDTGEYPHGQDWLNIGANSYLFGPCRDDLHIYVTPGPQRRGEKVARIGIRMHQGEIAEIRGMIQMRSIVGGNIDIEPTMLDTAHQKAQALPGYEKFRKIFEDMQKVRELARKTAKNEPLTLDELRFLYQLDQPAENFGFSEESDQLIHLQHARNNRKDLATLFDCTEEQVAVGEKNLTDESVVLIPSRWVNMYDRHTMPKNLRCIYGSVDFQYSNSQISDLGNLEYILGSCFSLGYNLKSLGKLKAITGYANFWHSAVESLGSLEWIGGDACLNGSSIRDLGNLRAVWGDVLLGESKGEGFYLSPCHVSSLGNLRFVGGKLRLEGVYLDNSNESKNVYCRKLEKEVYN